jgi:hypothetical protein
LLVDCFIVTETGLLKVCFNEDDLVEIKRLAQDIGDQAIIDFNIHLEGGRMKNVQARPNYILMKMCIQEGRTFN